MYRFPSATREQLKDLQTAGNGGNIARGQTSKTSKEHATAFVDDVPARTENRPQEPRHPVT